MSEFKMPSLGADMESAVLMEWLVKEGDTVTKGQVIAEVETSKGVIEIEVFEDGVVEKLLVEEETECAVGTPLAMIRSEGGSLEKEAAPEEKVTIQEPMNTASETKEPLTVFETQTKEQEHSYERVKVSPAARKKAAEMGIDLNTLASKKEGAVHLKDVESIPAKEEERAPVLSGMRQAIAKAMSRSNAEIPHYYLSVSINMTPALAWLETMNAQRSIQERILPAALLIRAVVRALEEVPELNGYWQHDNHLISKSINPGIAIALRKGGLITPALVNAQEMDLDMTMRALDDLITRTRSNKLRGSEMSEQTITITNLGDLGVERVYGVIYPPQVAIVGLGRIVDSPWAEGDALCVRKVMQATLAGDHRATDGRTGALFLERLNQILQRPEELS